MTLLVRATELAKRPVVTLTGEDVAQIKDVVYDPLRGAVTGFTLSGRGIFAGPLKVALPAEAVTAIGRDAVMIANEDALVERDAIAERADMRERNVVGNKVLTDSGTELGRVTDVILQVGRETDVVGYEIEPTAAVRADGHRVLIPLPDTLSVSGEALMVPARAVEFVSDDLSGFGAAVEEFRTRLRGER